MIGTNKENFSFVKTGVLLLLLTIIAKFFAFGRELAVAAYFGSSSDTDSFFIANGLVGNVIYGLIIALTEIFLPYYVAEKEQNGRDAANKLAGQTFVFFLIFTVLFSLFFCAIADTMTKLVAPDVPIEQAQQIAFFMRVMTIGTIFHLMNSFACSLLDAEKIYEYTAISGIIQSCTIIAAAVIFSKYYGISTLIFAVVVAHLLQFAFSGWRSRKFITLTLPSKNDPRLWNMFLASLPILLSNATVEINQVINRTLAFKLGPGMVSAFSYASTLMAFVSTTLSYSLVTMFFTELSQVICKEDSAAEIRKILRTALNIFLLILLPVSCITFICSEDIVTLAFKRGKFTEDDVFLTASGLRWFAAGFLGVLCKALFTKCFIAIKNTKTPMLVSIGEVGVNIVLAFLLYKKFQVAGITAAITIANICAAVTLLLLLNRKLGGKIILWSWKYTVKILFLSAVSVALLLLSQVLNSWNAWFRFPVAAIAVFAVYLPMYWSEAVKMLKTGKH